MLVSIQEGKFVLKNFHNEVKERRGRKTGVRLVLKRTWGVDFNEKGSKSPEVTMVTSPVKNQG